MSNPNEPDVQALADKIASMQKASDASGLNDLKKGVAAQRPAIARIDLSNVREAFTYQPWDQAQVDAGKRVTDALIAAAETILRDVPESPLRTRAINGLFDARMVANAAITHRGKY